MKNKHFYTMNNHYMTITNSSYSYSLHIQNVYNRIDRIKLIDYQLLQIICKIDINNFDDNWIELHLISYVFSTVFTVYQET